MRREGRFTPAQRRAFDVLWPQWGVDFDGRQLDLEALFGRAAPCILEIGFGNGETLAKLAAAAPQTDFLGIEVHRPGVGRLLNRLDAARLSNVRVICHDAVEVLESQIGPGTLAGVNIFFPDPWPKKRHHKRRLIKPGFLDLLVSRMQPGACLHVATDWENYAEHIGECLAANSRLTETEAGLDRPRTHFERRGRRLGHAVWDFVYRRA